jgi:hypothetical protein
MMSKRSNTLADRLETGASAASYKQQTIAVRLARRDYCYRGH